MGPDTSLSPTVPAQETPPWHMEEQMAHQPGGRRDGLGFRELSVFGTRRVANGSQGLP